MNIHNHYIRRESITLGFDTDGNIEGLEDVPFRIPYPSDNPDVNLTFQKKIKALLKPSADEPLKSPVDVYRKVVPHRDNVYPFPGQYQKIGSVVGFENPGMYPFKSSYFGPPKPMTLKIKFYPITIHREIGHALLNNLDFHVVLWETPGTEISGPSQYLVLEPIPARPACVTCPPGKNLACNEEGQCLATGEEMPELPFGRKAVEAIDKAMEVVAVAGNPFRLGCLEAFVQKVSEFSADDFAAFGVLGIKRIINEAHALVKARGAASATEKEEGGEERRCPICASEPFQVRFDGPPGPEPGRFIEIEDMSGNSISKGRWEEDGDTGNWLLIFDGQGSRGDWMQQAVRDALALCDLYPGGDEFTAEECAFARAIGTFEEKYRDLAGVRRKRDET